MQFYHDTITKNNTIDTLKSLFPLNCIGYQDQSQPQPHLSINIKYTSINSEIVVLELSWGHFSL